MQPLKDILESSTSRAGRVVDLGIQGLIVLSLITFSIETLPNLDANTRHLLRVIEVITIIIFTVEYLFRVLVTSRRLRFIFSFYGLIDLVAILPFYLALGADLRSLRIFRLFRLARVLKLVRYSKAIRRFGIAFRMVKEELILFTVATLFLMFIAGVGIYYFENEAQPEQFASVFHSLWWAVATLTTVGYGDIAPVTVGGKMFTFVVLIIGLGVVAVPTGLLSSALTRSIVHEEYSSSEARKAEMSQSNTTESK